MSGSSKRRHVGKSHGSKVEPERYRETVLRLNRLLGSAGAAWDAGDDDQIDVMVMALRGLLVDRLLDHVLG